MPVANLQSNSVQEQIAYMEQIHISFIDFWSHICDLTQINLSTPDEQQGGRKSATSQKSMIDFFNLNSFDLFSNIILYLRKQLKVPEYNQMFEENEEFKQEDFDRETA